MLQLKKSTAKCFENIMKELDTLKAFQGSDLDKLREKIMDYIKDMDTINTPQELQASLSHCLEDLELFMNKFRRQGELPLAFHGLDKESAELSKILSEQHVVPSDSPSFSEVEALLKKEPIQDIFSDWLALDARKMAQTELKEAISSGRKKNDKLLEIEKLQSLFVEAQTTLEVSDDILKKITIAFEALRDDASHHRDLNPEKMESLEAALLGLREENASHQTLEDCIDRVENLGGDIQNNGGLIR